MRKEQFAPAPKLMEEPPPLPEQHGAPWTPVEDELLLTAFNGGMSLDQISRYRQRKPSAIVSRLVKMGLLIAVAGEYKRLGPTFCTFRDIGRPL